MNRKQVTVKRIVEGDVQISMVLNRKRRDGKGRASEIVETVARLSTDLTSSNEVRHICVE